MGLRPTHEDENRGLTFDRVDEGGSPRIRAGGGALQRSGKSSKSNRAL